MNFNRLVRTVEPASLPLSIDDVKQHLRIASNDDETYLSHLIEVGTAYIDGAAGIGIALVPQTWEMSLEDLWPSFTIPLNPVRSVDKIEWTDRNYQVQSSTQFCLNKRVNPAHVWHDIRADAFPGSVVVTFTAGYTTIPADLRHALLMIIGHLYQNAEATTDKKLETVPMAVDSILNRYRAC